MQRVRFPIHHTFGPLVTRDQWKQAFRLQFAFGAWREGAGRKELRSALGHHFGMPCALFATGREALLAALRSLELRSGDEVIVQGYTCVVVPNAIHAANATPVYADIDPETLSLDPDKVQAKITSRTRAIICQHTFGIPAPMERLRSICDKRGLVLIEDAAHIIPSHESSDSIGRHSDFVLLSFGRDKAISGVSGGAILARDEERAKALRQMEDETDHLPRWQILNLIEYPLRYGFARWLWRLPFGSLLAKAYLKWVRLLRFLPPILSSEEKQGRMGILLHRMPNACALFALHQIRQVAALNQHRRNMTDLYMRAAKEQEWRVPEGASLAPALQKFPLYVHDADGLRRTLKHEQIYLDDGWVSAVVNPRSVDPVSAAYEQGSCPVAEDVAKHIVTLPTHPTTTKEQATYLVHAARSSLFLQR